MVRFVYSSLVVIVEYTYKHKELIISHQTFLFRVGDSFCLY